MFLGKGKCRNVQYSVGAAAMATGILITLLFNFNSLLNLTFALCKCLTVFGKKRSPVVLIPQSHIHWKTFFVVLAKSVRWPITLTLTLFFLPRFFSFLFHQYYQQYYQQFYSQPGMAQQAQAQQGYIQYPSQPAQYVYYPQQPYGLVYIWQPDRAGPF